MAKITIKGKEFITGIQKVSYARSKNKDLKNKTVSGICLSLRKDNLNLVAVNGHRLALYSIPTESSESIDVVISEKTAKEIVKKIKKKEDIEIEIDNSKLIISGIECDLIQGRYPDYEGFYPKRDGFDVEIVVSKEKLLEAINTVVKERPFEEEGGKYDVVRFAILNDAKKMIVSASNHETMFEDDNTYNHVEIDININFNYFFYDDFIMFFSDRYVQEAIKPIESENVIIRFSRILDQTDRAEFTDGLNYSTLVMPTRGWL